jgi:subtilisin family serine protease
MKVTVTKNLNVRVGKPSVNAPTHQYLTPGSVIKTDGQLYKGDPYDGIDTWVKDEAGNYYWSGGVKKSTTSLSKVKNNISLITSSTDLPRLIQLNNTCSLSSKGIGGIVAILDSGVSNSLFKGRIILEENFIGNSADSSDAYGHGTKVAGIICGNGPLIKSLASLCSIINYRIADENGVVTSDPVYYALDKLDKLPTAIDVVNLSFDTPSNLIPYIQSIINNLCNKGTIVVVAAGNGDTLNSISSLQNVIKVGAIKEEYFNSIKEKGLNKVYDCAFIDIPISSTSNKEGHDEICQVSAYTALASSMICAFLRDVANAQLQGAQKITAVKQFLNNCSFPVSREDRPQNFKPLKP